MKPASIHLHIDELVLDGFDPRQRHEISDAILRELTARLARHDRAGIHSGNVHLERLDGGEILVTDRAGARVGQQIAHTVDAVVGSAVGDRRPPALGARTR